ncbi:DUF3618 domain-containing protein [Nocardia callitridis]|uniref:DUF3618 domain-containing protein n=1 Tax=Nocardia callitridis TaxID=648753 RepID=A0ABP9L0R4_9NOCA
MTDNNGRRRVDVNAPGRATEEELLRADRDLTRDELGQTIAALAEKADVKARAQETLHDTAETVRDKAAETGEKTAAATAMARDRTEEGGKRILTAIRSNPAPIAAVALSAVGAWWLLRRRSTTKHSTTKHSSKKRPSAKRPASRRRTARRSATTRSAPLRAASRQRRKTVRQAHAGNHAWGGKPPVQGHPIQFRRAQLPDRSGQRHGN